jgi:uncharacterized membrane protein YgdD (TMEM256/DUF423 family)
MGIIQKLFLLSAGISGAVGVILGAIGSHWLKDRLNYWELSSFDTGVRYQLFHTLTLLALVLLMDKLNSPLLTWSGCAFITGILLFSGSIYLLSIKNIFHIYGSQFLGPITPIGGLLLIIGWVLIAITAIQELRS